MSEPDGPDATRRTLLRGVVVLGVVGAGAGLSRLGEGTFELATPTGAETDIVAQAPTEPAASAEPTASAVPEKSAKTSTSTKSTKPAKTAEKAESAKAKSGKAAETTESAKAAKSGKAAETTESAKAAKSGKAAGTTEAAKSGKASKPAKAPKPAGAALGPANKVPVGGGAVYKDKRVVVTQPKAGEYKVFDALCTHANCLVDEVKAGAIHCPCHSAKFSIADGTVVKPSVARRPLNPKGTVTEADGTLYLT